VFAVNPTVPFKHIRELVEYARANPGKVSYSHPGLGQPQHLSGELLGLMAGIKMVHVPYKGGAPAIIDAIGGQVTMVIAGVPPLLSHIKAGKLRPIGVTSSARFQLLPDIPTVAEQGYPGYEVDFWVGMMVPAKVPAAIIARLNEEVNVILKTPSVRAQLLENGAEPVGGSPEAFAGFVKRDMEKWAKLVKSLGLKPQ
jgi:tripartite-type tricarboxylate transporter receptor subunit TctC